MTKARLQYTQGWYRDRSGHTEADDTASPPVVESLTLNGKGIGL